MTTNLRSSSTIKEDIYDYIDVIKIYKTAAGREVAFKSNFGISLRKLLQNYNSDLDEETVSENPRYSDKNLQCFVDAANTKHDVYSHDAYYAEIFSGAIVGALFGVVIAVITSGAWMHVAESGCKVSKDNLKYVGIGGVV